LFPQHFSVITGYIYIIIWVLIYHNEWTILKEAWTRSFSDEITCWITVIKKRE